MKQQPRGRSTHNPRNPSKPRSSPVKIEKILENSSKSDKNPNQIEFSQAKHTNRLISYTMRGTRPTGTLWVYSRSMRRKASFQVASFLVTKCSILTAWLVQQCVGPDQLEFVRSIRDQCNVRQVSKWKTWTVRFRCYDKRFPGCWLAVADRLRTQQPRSGSSGSAYRPYCCWRRCRRGRCRGRRPTWASSGSGRRAPSSASRRRRGCRTSAAASPRSGPARAPPSPSRCPRPCCRSSCLPSVSQTPKPGHATPRHWPIFGIVIIVAKATPWRRWVAPNWWVTTPGRGSFTRGCSRNSCYVSETKWNKCHRLRSPQCDLKTARSIFVYNR